jgi:hypothetical protein
MAHSPRRGNERLVRLRKTEDKMIHSLNTIYRTVAALRIAAVPARLGTQLFAVTGSAAMFVAAYLQLLAWLDDMLPALVVTTLIAATTMPLLLGDGVRRGLASGSRSH